MYFISFSLRHVHSTIVTYNISPLMFTDLLPPCRGQSPMEADLNLLETARRCELFGVKMHPVKVRLCRPMSCKGKDASLGPI